MPQQIVEAVDVTEPPAQLTVATAEDMLQLGRRLAVGLQAGDLIIATGELGAGKTVLAQGIAAGLGVTEAVTSPTFVLVRWHRTGQGPDFVHADAYRLGSAAELDDIDIDGYLPESVVYIEWGAGLAEAISEDRLEIEISRHPDDSRLVTLQAVGQRWATVSWDDLLGDQYD